MKRCLVLTFFFLMILSPANCSRKSEEAKDGSKKSEEAGTPGHSIDKGDPVKIKNIAKNKYRRWKTYREPNGLYHFRYPKPISFIESKDGRLVFAMERDGELSFMPINVRHFKLTEGYRIKPVIADILKPFREKANYKLLLKQRHTWEGKGERAVFYKVLAVWGEEEKPTRLKLYAYMKDNDIWTFHYKAAQESYLALNPYFTKMLDSLEPGEADKDGKTIKATLKKDFPGKQAPR